jgi:hypothetical protein
MYRPQWPLRAAGALAIKLIVLLIPVLTAAGMLQVAAEAQGRARQGKARQGWWKAGPPSY